MTRFVYVLPAGRLRWEVRVEDDPVRALVDEFERMAGKEVTGERFNPDKSAGISAGFKDCARELRKLLPSRHPRLFYRRKAHALIAARAIAIIIGGEVQPHNRWGRIQDPDSFGGDSPRRRG